MRRMQLWFWSIWSKADTQAATLQSTRSVNFNWWGRCCKSLKWDLNTFEDSIQKIQCISGPGSGQDFLSKVLPEFMVVLVQDVHVIGRHHALVSWQEMAACPSATTFPLAAGFRAVSFMSCCKQCSAHAFQREKSGKCQQLHLSGFLNEL